MTFVRTLGIACALLLAATAGVAQQPSTPSTETPAAGELEKWVGPEPTVRSPPDYPSAAMAKGREGWVALSYIVTKEGKVTDAMIEDSTGSEDLERSALQAVQRWRYKPATRNGEPVDHPMIQTVIRFEMQGQKGGRKEFGAKWQEIAGLVTAGDVARAEELLTALGTQERRTLYEDAWYWWLRYDVLAATKTPDREELLTALSRAVGYEVEYLPPDMFLSAASRLFLLRIQNNDLGGALRAFDKLTNSKGAKQAKDYQRVMAVLDDNVKKIRDVIAGPAALSSEARVGSHDYWVHSLVRKSFELAEIQGELHALELRCKRHNLTYTPVTDQRTWTVPASWDDCGVYVRGTPGTTFKFYEHPDHG